MVDREECKDTINKVINTGNVEYMLLLLDYLCQIKGFSEEEKDKAITTISLYFGVLSTITPNILEELERHFNLIRVTDKNSNIILVY